MSQALKVHPRDNVAVALRPLPRGTTIHVNGEPVTLRQALPAKHKVALAALSPGDPVVMYGVLVGRATEPIPEGGAVTTQNVAHAAQAYAGRSKTFTWSAPNVGRWRNRSFPGYHRADGQVGTANYWLVIPLTFCENRNVAALKEAFEKELGFAHEGTYQDHVSQLAAMYRSGRSQEEIRAAAPPQTRLPSSNGNRVFENLDGVRFLVHQMGCGGTRQDARSLCGLLAGYIHHPNVAGATVLSLGCQNAQVDLLQEELRRRDPEFSKPLVILEQQQSGSEYQMLSSAVRESFLGMMEANRVERRPAPLSALTIGVECGGSDGFSGISANPAIGHTADLIVTLGGRVILSEFPELCGVEQEIIDRCVSDEVAERFRALMNAYAARAEAVGAGFDMNPSPGNIRDGLLTDAMKSAGAAKKGGTSPVTDVIDYPDYATEAGLSLLCTPGNDVESTTALAGAGANVILFSTGLGTPTGNPVAPVVKVSSNSELALRMPDIIDFDTGGVVSGEQSIDEAGEALLELVIRVAGGELETCAQKLGQYDFIPWKRDISL